MKKVLFVVLVMLFIGMIGMAQAAGLSTTDLNGGVTPASMVTSLLGGGIAVSNIVYTGANNASGVFSGGTGIIGFESGILLTSGSAPNVIGPNVSDWITTDNGLPGNATLGSLIPGYTTYDASILSFDFVPTNSSNVQFSYVFSSDEYNEYANTSYNDVFGFFVNGVNYALIPGTTTPVSINNVNGGGPTYGNNPHNSAYYINNDLSNGGGSINTEMDGLTVVLNMIAPVNPNVTNTMMIGIADAGDRFLDSAVFIQGGSFQTCGGPGQPPCGGVIPEPSTFLLLGAGIVGVGLLRKRFNK